MTAESNLKNAAEALSESEEISVLTAGISMRPMLREHKDIAVIRRTSGRLKRNDVPLYSRPGSEKFILHRILKVTPNGYVIRGDNLFKKEYDIKDENIVGVLRAFYRGGRYIDCEKSRGYKLYVFLNRASYPARYFWRGLIRPTLGKIKRRIIRKNY